MIINDFDQKSKSFLEKIKPFYNLLFILVVASIFFALGKILALESSYTPIKIEFTLAEVGLPQLPQGEVVASKNGTKYYFPWCGSASRIKPENQIKFASVELAIKAGYTPAGNCKGLK